MAVLMVPPYLQFLDNNGIPLAGGFVGTYSSGSDTPKATYTDNTEGTPADNPVELDAYGRATIWVNGSYRFKIYDSNMNLLRTTDGVTSFSVPAAAANSYFQSFSGTGAQTVFTTSISLGTDENELYVWVDAGAGKGYEIANPSTYTISGTSLTFAVAPASGTNNIYVRSPSQLLGAASASAAAAATSETNAAASAVLASQWATLTSGIVAATDYSAKAWAIGGTGVTGVSGKGAAKEWATTTGAAVDTSEFSAKEYATGTAVTTGSAKSWATLTSGLVASVDGSAKAWAIGGTGITTTSAKGAAKEWATTTSGAVDTSEYSAKAYAIGGTGVTSTSGKGAAKEWATTTGAAVDTSEFSAKEYATGTTVTTGSAKSWATLTSGLVATVDGSAKAWAIGGTGISATSGKGASKEWAITTGAAVDTSEYSAKEYAVGTTVAVGSAKDWATKTSAAVNTTFSAKEYAQGTQAATGGSAKNWAQQTGADVTGAAANSRSAKSWSQDDLTGATLGGSAKDWAQSSSKPDGTLESAKTYATNAGVIAAGCLATSTTSLLIAVASKVFTTQAGKQFQAGSYIIATSAANPANYMHGQVTSYSGTTLTVDVQDIGGSGTLADWNISLSGTRGAIGATGATGSIPIAAAGGTADAITANFTPDLTLTDQTTCFVVAASANATTTPTFAPDGLTARTIVKKGGGALVAGDIAAAGHVILLEYNLANTRWELLNPAKTTESDLVLADNTTADASTTKHGLMPKGTNTAGYYYNSANGQTNPALVSPLTGYASGAGTVSAADTALTAIQKLNGNIAALATMSCVLNTQSSSYTLVASDLGKLVDFTGSSDQTWAFTAAATLATGWFCYIRNSGTSGAAITLDPNSTEQIDGLTTFKMYPGEVRLVQCTGSAFNSFVIQGFVISTTSSFTFTKPPGYKAFDVRCGAGGGGGGRSVSGSTGNGGGGGACHERSILASSVGTTESITVGAAGASRTGSGQDGGDGGNTTFGSLLTAYGGGGGGSFAVTGGYGGGGGGITSAGTVLGIGGGPIGGLVPVTTTALQRSESSIYGGGGGGLAAANTLGVTGGDSIWGGGGGGGLNTTGTASNMAGGKSVYGGGGGGSSGTATAAGAGGTSAFGGAGGAGVIDAGTATSGTASADGYGGGGGGGSEFGTSGAGGKGSIRIVGAV